METMTQTETPTTPPKVEAPASTQPAEDSSAEGDSEGSPDWDAAVAAVERGEPMPDYFESPEQSAAEGEGEDTTAPKGEDNADATPPAPENKNTVDWEAKFNAQTQQIESMKALLAKMAEQTKSEPAPAKTEPPPKPALSKEAQELLEYTPALNEIIEAKAREIAAQLLEGTKKEVKNEQLLTQQQQEEARRESQYLGQLSTSFQSEFPDLKLEAVHGNPDYSDWLDQRKNWVKSVMQKCDRYDPSGELTVIKRFISETYPNRAQAGEKRQVENQRRLAAAKLPGGNPTRTPKVVTTTSWDDAVKAVMAQDQGHTI